MKKFIFVLLLLTVFTANAETRKIPKGQLSQKDLDELMVEYNKEVAQKMEVLSKDIALEKEQRQEDIIKIKQLEKVSDGFIYSSNMKEYIDSFVFSINNNKYLTVSQKNKIKTDFASELTSEQKNAYRNSELYKEDYLSKKKELEDKKAEDFYSLQKEQFESIKTMRKDSNIEELIGNINSNSAITNSKKEQFKQEVMQGIAIPAQKFEPISLEENLERGIDAMNKALQNDLIMEEIAKENAKEDFIRKLETEGINRENKLKAKKYFLNDINNSEYLSREQKESIKREYIKKGRVSLILTNIK